MPSRVSPFYMSDIGFVNGVAKLWNLVVTASICNEIVRASP